MITPIDERDFILPRLRALYAAPKPWSLMDFFTRKYKPSRHEQVRTPGRRRDDDWVRLTPEQQAVVTAVLEDEGVTTDERVLTFLRRWHT